LGSGTLVRHYGTATPDIITARAATGANAGAPIISIGAVRILANTDAVLAVIGANSGARITGSAV